MIDYSGDNKGNYVNKLNSTVCIVLSNLYTKTKR